MVWLGVFMWFALLHLRLLLLRFNIVSFFCCIDSCSPWKHAAFGLVQKLVMWNFQECVLLHQRLRPSNTFGPWGYLLVRRGYVELVPVVVGSQIVIHAVSKRGRKGLTSWPPTFKYEMNRRSHNAVPEGWLHKSTV